MKNPCVPERNAPPFHVDRRQRPRGSARRWKLVWRRQGMLGGAVRHDFILWLVPLNRIRNPKPKVTPQITTQLSPWPYLPTSRTLYRVTGPGSNTHRNPIALRIEVQFGIWTRAAAAFYLFRPGGFYPFRPRTQ
jgi:hypothetical protein